jgi:hypothetical protein
LSIEWIYSRIAKNKKGHATMKYPVLTAVPQGWTANMAVCGQAVPLFNGHDQLIVSVWY